MISKKVCMLGSFSVGKTSLVEKFVHSIFSDKYLSTVGVKISKRIVQLDDKDLTFVLWDMEGQDLYSSINMSFLRGAMGYFIVMDGLRAETYQIGLEIYAAAQKITGKDIPCYFLINKADLQDKWEITQKMTEELKSKDVKVFFTSAKLGLGVEEAFFALGREMCGVEK